MNNRNYLSYLIIILLVPLFGLNPQIKNELPISRYINPEQYISADSLLEFEAIGYQINDSVEKSKYYFIVAYLLNEKIIELNVKIDNINEKLSNLIKSYESELLLDNYIVNYNMPTPAYSYKYIKFSDKGVVNKVFYKQANILKGQYIDIYNAGVRKIELLSDYLLSLREDYLVNKTGLINFGKKENLENKFYFTLHDILSSNLIEKSNLNPLNTIVDKHGNTISIIQIENIGNKEIFFSKDFEYFGDNLLAAIREKKDGNVTREILYGNNKYSQKFYDFIFDSSFETLNYDNFTEVYYQLNDKISYIDFFTFDGVKIGSIEYKYDYLNRLIDEKWYQGERLLVREFNCFYKEGEGSYRVIEKNKYGEIVFQDIVNSKNEHIKIEGK